MPSRAAGPETRERDHTDKRLRIERAGADEGIAGRLARIDQTADAVLNRARARADELLEAARATTDRNSKRDRAASRTVKSERRRADTALSEERATADQLLREERTEKSDVLDIERDHTDHDLLSERARADRMLAARDEFLGVVAHELRNMLVATLGFAELIAEEVTGDKNLDQVLSYTGNIERAGARMNRLIGDLIDLATIEAGYLTVTPAAGDPVAVVREAVDTFQAQAVACKVSLTAEIVPPLPPVRFDSARVLQVLANLLSNAIKFTPSHGTVVVRVEHVDADILFGVTDTGAGIPAEQLDAIFERYLQGAAADRRGVGLGLYISRRIVQGHGGRIWATSTIGQGSTVYFTLPVAQHTSMSNND